MSSPRSSVLDHRGDVARIVLQVAVRGDDVAPARMGEAGREGGGLAEVAAEADDTQPRVCRLQPRQAESKVSSVLPSSIATIS